MKTIAEFVWLWIWGILFVIKKVCVNLKPDVSSHLDHREYTLLIKEPLFRIPREPLWSYSM